MSKTLEDTKPKPEQPKTVKELFKSDYFRQQIALALPKHLTPDRFLRVGLTAIFKNPKLAQCSVDSFIKCMMDLSSVGLEPDGWRAHLIPYGKECGKIIDYKGYVELIRRGGQASYIHADVVYTKDHFVYRYGSNAILDHVPFLKSGDNDRGAMYAAYSYVRLKDGSESFVVMNKAQVDAIRKRSKAGFKDDSPWTTDYDEMAKKTPFRNHAKWLPMSPEFQRALDMDDDRVIDIPAAPDRNGGASDFARPFVDTSFLDTGIAPEPAEHAELFPGSEEPAEAGPSEAKKE